MIGKHKTRAASFTLIHAGILMIALGLTPLLKGGLDSIRAQDTDDAATTTGNLAQPQPLRISCDTWQGCISAATRDVDV